MGLRGLGDRLYAADVLSVEDQIVELVEISDVVLGMAGVLLDQLRETGGLGVTSFTTPKSWLAAKANIGSGGAARIVATGRLASRFDAIGTAVEEGVLSSDHMVWLKRCLPANRTVFRAEMFARDHKMLVDFARDLPFSEYLIICRNWIEACNANDPSLTAPEEQDLGLDFTDNRDGTTSIKGLILTTDANALKEALRRLVEDTKTLVLQDDENENFSEAHGPPDPGAASDDSDALMARDPDALDFSISEYTLRPVVRKGSRYWKARALTLLASRATTAPAHGKSPEPLVVVHIDWDTYNEELDRYINLEPPLAPDRVFRQGFLCEDAGRSPYRPGQVFELSLRHAVARAVIGAKSRTVDLGRKSRLFTGGARDAVIWRDRSCVEPGCDQPGREIDHIVEWDRNGRTDPINGDYLCTTHHGKRTHEYNQRRWAEQRKAQLDQGEPF